MQVLTYVDPPGPFDTLETWERYRKGLDVVEGPEFRQMLIESADAVIVDLKAGRKPHLSKMI